MSGEEPRSADTTSPKSEQSHGTSWPEPPKEEAFYGLAGECVRLVGPHTEADPVALLVQFLVAFGSLIGRAAHWLVEADRHFMNLFAVIVGKTAKAGKEPLSVKSSGCLASWTPNGSRAV